MKKGVKTALIIAAACIGVGAVLTGAGYAAGGFEEPELVEGYIEKIDRVTGRYTGLWDSAAGEYMSFWDKAADSWIGRWLPEAVSDNDHGFYNGEKEEHGQEVYSGDFEAEVPYSGSLLELDVEMGVHGLEIVEGNDDRITIRGTNCDRIQCYVKDGILHVKDVGRHKKVYKTTGRTLQLTIPSGIKWAKADLEAGMGYVEMWMLEAREASLDADMGYVAVEFLTAEEADLEADMGSVTVGEGNIGELDISASMGSVKVTGTVSGNVEAEADMGSCVLTLRQSVTDFNYEITTSMGSVELNGEEYSGLDKEKLILNGAPRTMELDSSMGSIEIYFK